MDLLHLTLMSMVAGLINMLAPAPQIYRRIRGLQKFLWDCTPDVLNPFTQYGAKEDNCQVAIGDSSTVLFTPAPAEPSKHRPHITTQTCSTTAEAGLVRTCTLSHSVDQATYTVRKTPTAATPTRVAPTPDYEEIMRNPLEVRRALIAPILMFAGHVWCHPP
ncbi:hypothetical protein BC835DRAFT_773845 [Cytidiella melzeri]|nr:hypothetical protein BC835DRAFT_773845 [Cytidiella melzeri]